MYPLCFKNVIIQEDGGIECLEAIANIMEESDVSPFEVIHSGLIGTLLQYLTSQSGIPDRDLRIRRFLHVFLNCPVSRTFTKIIFNAKNFLIMLYKLFINSFI